ncbi:MAG: hypothetical protein WC997_12850 [Porticoccaceae bacterium]
MKRRFLNVNFLRISISAVFIALSVVLAYLVTESFAVAVVILILVVIVNIVFIRVSASKRREKQKKFIDIYGHFSSDEVIGDTNFLNGVGYYDGDPFLCGVCVCGNSVRIKIYRFSASKYGCFLIFWKDVVSFSELESGGKYIAKFVFAKKNGCDNTLFLPWEKGWGERLRCDG